jgi:hypothetical protein
VPWDDAVGRGPEAFAREVAAGDRGAPRRRQPVAVGPGGPGAYRAAAPGNGRGNGNGNGSGDRLGHGTATGNAAGTAGADLRTIGLGRRPEVEYVSPLRGGIMPESGPLERPLVAGTATLPRIAPAEPVATYADAPGSLELGDHDVEPALPDEARSRAVAEAASATAPLEAGRDGDALHIRFASAPGPRVVDAVKVITQLVRERPGDTEVVLHVPAPGGRPQPMPLPRRVAYDAELLAEVRRRLGEGFVDLQLGGVA